MDARLVSVVSLIDDDSIADPRAKVLGMNFRGYLAAYGRGNFETAAVYGRRMAEVFCVHCFPEGHPAAYDGLRDMSWARHYWWTYAADFVVGFPNILRIGEGLGMALSSWSIFEDLTKMREYGNSGGHVCHDQLEAYGLQADEEAFMSTLRIVLCSLALFRYKPLARM